MRHIRLAVSLLALLAVPVTSQQALAAWPHDPSLGNVGVCTLGSDQGEAVVISDGAGGSIMHFFFVGFGLRRLGVEHGQG